MGERVPHLATEDVPLNIQGGLIRVLTEGISDGTIPPIIDCWSCETELSLVPKQMSWPIGRRMYQVGNVPTYSCDDCNKDFYPQAVLECVATSIEGHQAEHPPTPPEVHPSVIAFYRIHRE